MRQGDGYTLREHYEAAGALDDLIGPACPAGLSYLLEWFGELAEARTGSGFGANPISYTELLAWATLTGRDPAPLEVRILRRLDATLLDLASAKHGGPRASGHN